MKLKKFKPKYILYYSGDEKFDGLGIYERIKLVNSYVLSNYKKYNDATNILTNKSPNDKVTQFTPVP